MSNSYGMVMVRDPEVLVRLGERRLHLKNYGYWRRRRRRGGFEEEPAPPKQSGSQQEK